MEVVQGRQLNRLLLLVAWKVPNVVLTPHIASATVPTRRAMADLAVDNLVGYLLNNKPVTPLNPAVIKA